VLLSRLFELDAVKDLRYKYYFLFTLHVPSYSNGCKSLLLFAMLFLNALQQRQPSFFRVYTVFIVKCWSSSNRKSFALISVLPTTKSFGIHHKHRLLHVNCHCAMGRPSH